MGVVQSLECLRCGRRHPVSPQFYGCPDCAAAGYPSNLTPTYDLEALRPRVSRSAFAGRGMWRFADLLPVPADAAVSLQEGDTPLHRAGGLAAEFGVRALYLKEEARNPTGSFKDRLCSVAVSMAGRFGAHVITASSTGNHGVAAAAYASRAGLDCVIFTNPTVPETMKVSMQACGARLVATPRPPDRWTVMSRCVEDLGWYPVSNPAVPPVGSNCFGIEGYKTIAYEICEQLDWAAPDRVVLPVCYGDGLWGIWKGFREFQKLGLIDRTPRMVAAEVFGPLAAAMAADGDLAGPVPAGPSLAFSIATPLSNYQGLRALRESGGLAVPLNDDAALLRWQRRLGQLGLYTEPSSCIGLAVLEQMAAAGQLRGDETVVVVLTATGLKDPGAAARVLPEVPVVQPELPALRDALAQVYGFQV